MKQGFVKVAAVTPKIKVADTVYNAQQICAGIDEAASKGAKIIVFPELCLSGYTCSDLFLQERLLTSCREQLKLIADHTQGKDSLVFVGLPLEREGKLYNVAAAVHDGEILAFIPKTFIPSYGEFYETRHFFPGNQEAVSLFFDGEAIPFGTNILLEAEGMDGLLVGCEICEDIWVPKAPGIAHAMAGATLLVNPSASNETISKDVYREMLVKSASAKLIAGYVYCSSGEGESTQDLVFGGHNIIA
ncbi:MAG: nitrilase-related carbon-nitrogen hydrolase, partial [Lachnospiraceae bacterium]|nr:nitrilase-related carbon-nitrogen hydrolase [Lachnospiraceae bacterium]